MRSSRLSRLWSSRCRVTNRERVLATLGAASIPIDDDELSRRTGIKPRQTVNQICNQLRLEGRLRRVAGPDGKIVNSLLPASQMVAAPTASAAGPMEPSAGSSHEQQAAESVMLAILGDALGVTLSPRRLEHSSGARVEVDGADASLTVLVECWAHQGTAKVAQKYKLVNDATKLHWIAGALSPPPRLILCVSDDAAVRHLRGKSWQGQAIASLGVEIHVVELPAGIVSSIAEAQKRQYR